MTTPRKLSDVVPQSAFSFENLVKAEELEGVVFVLQRGWVIDTRFGPRAAFELTTEEGQTHTLLLALDGYRQAIIDQLADGPIGPVTLVRKQGRFNNPYWLLTDEDVG